MYFNKKNSKGDILFLLNIHDEFFLNIYIYISYFIIIHKLNIHTIIYLKILADDF
jgi:hypothetical protein